ncbi:MAG: hypothetical protein ACI94Y_002622, partial [Maribacter sp.]
NSFTSSFFSVQEDSKKKKANNMNVFFIGNELFDDLIANYE